ncbi:uncharacterized protein LOC131676700 isoform X2 [Topomyia yanbarensis]|uniref:uncharacterized protein LOC131676700 isoform X2 n=1 Tax=Topomyia yanbarensis TaxID=2498891 RepID=UPI00273C6B70|nr:uncharacterized protein LOC131676700 isoform X2 [Topomyia yanbarensis]XP_058811935.1 uncharacterized protein LOC131676700 isoform X2 [Topomyia yanbarensis]
MLMVDSGNESADRLESLFLDNFKSDEHNLADSDAESDIYSKMNELDVVFANPKQPNQQPSGEVLVDDPAAISRRILTSDNSTESYASSGATISSVSTQDDEVRGSQKLTQINTCKILQRKLELKVERAKRNYRQMYEEQDLNQELATKSASMIPISRLAIPGGGSIRDSQQPLVDVNPAEGNSDEDELEPVSFFPRPDRNGLANQRHTRQELSDTFSIQEMTIESDQEDELDYEQCRKLSNSKGYKKILNRAISGEGEDYLDNDAEDDDDAQNLELLPPRAGYGLKELVQRVLCCSRKNELFS